MGLMLMFTSSCQKDADPDPEPQTISDENFYGQIGGALVRCYNDIYNQNLAGKPTGAQNITANGPMGGTVVITGSDSFDDTHGITSTNLIFTMTNVNYTLTTTTTSGKSCITHVTLTGATTHTGSFSDSYTSVNHQSENIHIVGSVTFDGTTRNIDQTGEVSINRSSTTSVNIFGYVVAW
jgi:beta-xylosidase